ncbi:hypothetical protein L484_014469 [Morus notabilis]|uniref:Uncharacterized protein n=1 Tax=Morus notabilis TaxID=981085 RepID=W9QUF6_9ROSA|nr:hypothetical protein L484_014469 [Morus notabilis]
MTAEVKLRAWGHTWVQLRSDWREYGKFGRAGRMVHEWFGVKVCVALLPLQWDSGYGQPQAQIYCRVKRLTSYC